MTLTYSVLPCSHFRCHVFIRFVATDILEDAFLAPYKKHSEEERRGFMSYTKPLTSALLAFSLVGAIGLTGCSSGDNLSDTGDSNAATSSEQSSTTSFGLGYLNSTAHVLAFVAQEEGYFADEGLDVTLTQFSSGTELVSALEANKLDAAFIGSVPTIVSQSSGHDVTIFGGAMTNGHGYVIDSKYTEGLDSWDVSILKGKTVAVPRTTIQELELLQLLKANNITYAEDDSADVKLVYFDSQKDAYTALASDEIDAASCYSPYTAIAVEAGYSVVYRCSDIDQFKDQPCCRQVALTSALEENPDKYVAFERALIRAYETYQADHDKTIADVKKYIDIPESQIEYELYEGYADSNPDPAEIATTSLKNDAVSFGYTTDYDIESLYNTTIYETALNDLIEATPNDETYNALKEHFEEAD
jgi:NitT/TauT family transport system substrate-binding protein